VTLFQRTAASSRECTAKFATMKLSSFRQVTTARNQAANVRVGIAKAQRYGHTAGFQVAIPDPAVAGEFFGFPLVFRRADDGVWRISEM
jgi:hypothetical protein